MVMLLPIYLLSLELLVITKNIERAVKEELFIDTK